MSSKLTNDEINLLRWAFAKNRNFRDWFADNFKVHIYTWINYYDALIDVNELPIHGIQEKLAEIGSTSKLLPTLSELRVAKELAKRNFEVELLLDKDRRFKSGKPPDLSISRGDLKIWVEVMRKFGDDINFLLYQKLTPLLKERDFALSIVYSEGLSKLAVDFSERSEKENMFEDFVKELEQHLKSLARNELPYTFYLKDEKISVESTEPGWGRISSYATSPTLVPSEKYVQQIEEAVRKKSSKRESWQKDYLAQPFLVFLDLGSIELHDAVYQALYGSTMFIDWLKPDEFGPQRVIYPKVVTDRLQGDQQKLLFQLGFDSRRHLYIDKPGIFVTEESARRNITGVATMFNGKIECFPNPFCDEVVGSSNLPELLDVPLTPFAIGGSGQSS
ncbi:hypothetical protein [Alkalinema sp. FACHB-956]|uniref:hypothetical protein n=1 Tax=Alkalinema sp. FACHB-956 TaxID=2692768 RepID=UPI00168503A1|nr:hypothetical protein [Alkalinema sp. FACHB-956]MBD2328913.1 hypothetical protein [Alkalinema sp. FACHB-956]